jgi:hypothetical protein
MRDAQRAAGTTRRPTLPVITQTNRIQSVLVGIRNRTVVRCLAGWRDHEAAVITQTNRIQLGLFWHSEQDIRSLSCR